MPLLHYGRANLIQAVVLSVRAVFGNFLLALLWGVLLAAGVIGSILLLFPFPLVFPLLAYASHTLYQQVFPLE